MIERRIALLTILMGLQEVAWGQTAVIRTGYVKVYESPQDGARKLTTLTIGDTVRVIEKQGAWVRLQLPDKRAGWMQLAETARGGPSETAQRQDTKAFAPRVNSGMHEAATPVTGTDQEARETSGASQSPGNAPAAVPAIHSGLGTSDADADLNLGVSFTLGALNSEFAYSGRFLYRTLPRVYLEAAFQHVPANSGSSFLVHSNLLYGFALSRRFEGWLTGGVGVVSTAPSKAVGAKSVSNMELNYGIGVRRQFARRANLRADVRRYAVLLNTQTKNYLEYAVGVMIEVK